MEITRLEQLGDAEWCANIMTHSEPWITLGRTFPESLAIINDPTKEVYLVKVDNSLAGFMILNMKGAFVGYIQTICIAPTHRGQGLGSKMLTFAEERIFQESPNVFLCVSSFNNDAKRLYEKVGYETIGELKNYLVMGHSEILMRKTIGPLREFNKDAKSI